MLPSFYRSPAQSRQARREDSVLTALISAGLRLLRETALDPADLPLALEDIVYAHETVTPAYESTSSPQGGRNSHDILWESQVAQISERAAQKAIGYFNPKYYSLYQAAAASKMSPLDLLLEENEDLTKDQIAKKYGVWVRTVNRNIEKLAAAQQDRLLYADLVAIQEIRAKMDAGFERRRRQRLARAKRIKDAALGLVKRPKSWVPLLTAAPAYAIGVLREDLAVLRDSILETMVLT